MKQHQRAQTIAEILRLLSPSADEAETATRNLASRDDKSLSTLLEELRFAAVHFHSNPRSAHRQQYSERTAVAHAKLRSGLRKLTEATSKLGARPENSDGRRRTAGESHLERQRRETAREVGLAAAQPIAIHSTPAVAELAEPPLLLRDRWVPLLLEPSTNEVSIERKPAKFYERQDPTSAPAVVVDESVLAISNVQDLVARQFSNLVSNIIKDGEAVRRISNIFERLVRDQVIEKYLELHTAALLRDVLGIIFDREMQLAVGHGLHKRDLELFDELRLHWSAPPSAVEPAFLRSASGSLAELDVIRGFVKMIAKTRAYNPDLIVPFSGGGTIVAG